MSRFLRYIIPLLFLMVVYHTAYGQGTKKTITVGYFEAGDYFLHKVIMGELRKHLEKLSNDDYEIVFDPYAYKTAEWNRDICRAMAGDLARKKNLDMIIAAGPWVIKDLIEAGYKKPIIGLLQPYPELTGLVDKDGRPAYPNLTLTYDPNKLDSDMKVMGKLFPDKKCGLLYFPSKDEFAHVSNRAKEIAQKYGLELLPAEGYGASGMYSFFIAFEKIRKDIDVLYLPPLWGLDLDMLREFFVQIHFNKIPTFVSEGFVLLEKGAMASNCDRPYLTEARIAAYKIDRIIKGISPGSLPTRFSETQLLCLNPNEAKKVNFKISRLLANNAKLVPEIPAEETERYTLTRAFEQAIIENADFQAEHLAYDRALLEAKKAYAEFKPDISAQAAAVTAGNEIEAARYNSILQRELFVDINLDQTIFSYPAIKEIQAAQKRKLIKGQDLKEAEKHLKETTSAAFLSCLEYEDKSAALNDVVNGLREDIEMAKTDFALGVTQSDYSPLLKVNLLKAQIDLVNARRELAVSRVILNCLLNRPPDNKFVLDRTGFDNESMIRLIKGFEYYSNDNDLLNKFKRFFVEYGIDHSITLETADLKVGLYRDLLSKNRGSYYPEVSLHAKYSYGSEFDPALSERDDYWSIGGLIRLPIYAGGSRTNEKRVLQSRYDEQLYKKDALRLKLVGDITSQLDILFARMTTLPLYYDSRNLSETIFSAEADKYGTEDISYDGLIIKERNLAEQDQLLIEDKYAFFKAYTGLLNMIGIGYLPANSSEEKTFFDNISEYMSN